jgi:hypothetical protein
VEETGVPGENHQQEWPERADIASLLTASEMLLHASPSMLVGLLHATSNFRKFLQSMADDSADDTAACVDSLKNILVKISYFLS